MSFECEYGTIKPTSPKWPRNTFSRNSFGLIASKLLQTLRTLFEKHNFFISFFARRPTFSFNPFKLLCLPFKSSFIDENTCFCGLCVYKRIVFKGDAEESEGFLASNSIFQLCSIEWSTKANENWFCVVWDFLQELAGFSTLQSTSSLMPPKIWRIFYQTDWFNPQTKSVIC